MLEALTHEQFEPYLNKEFAIHAGEHVIPCELIENRALSNGREGVRTPFSIVFWTQEPKALPQAIWKVSHAGLGSLDIFLVPIGPDRTRGGMRYEAVFT